MDPAFKDAPFAAAPEVFGARLLPFCLGHAATLLAMDSPLFTGEPWTAKALATAVVVCALPGFALSGLNAQEGWAKMAVDVGAASAEAADWETNALPVFLAYARAAMRAPRVWEKDGWRERGTPWPWAIATALMAELPEERVWTMPLNRAVCYFMAGKEAAGAFEIVTDQDATLIEAEEAAKRAAAGEPKA